MGFEQDFRKMIAVATQTKFRNATALAETAGVSQASLSQFISGKRKSLSLESVSKLLDTIGLSLSSSPELAREVCFVDTKVVPSGEGLSSPPAEDYFAVPLVEEVGAGPGQIPQDKLLSWLLVWRWQEGIRNRSSNLIGVKLASKADSMLPLLHPGDIVLVDRNDRVITNNGKIWLVTDPLDNSGMIKRVATVHEEKDTLITYYSDNPIYPSKTYSLEEDFYGDWHRAIVGRVVWAWSDVSNK